MNLFDPVSFLRVVVFAAVFAGIEFRYINRREVGLDTKTGGLGEKPVMGLFLPYHLYFLLPLFIVASFSLPVTAWAGNTFAVALLEDVSYFVWRGRWVSRGEWTTRHFGSLSPAGLTVPVWWILDALIVAFLYLLPF